MIAELSTKIDEHDDVDAAHGDGDIDRQPGNHGNTLVLSLYLIHSEEDLLHINPGTNDCNKRARLYQRLSQACAIANDILMRSSSSNIEIDRKSSKSYDTKTKNFYPWSSGGDGPIFGVHCDIHSDNGFMNPANDMDGDDVWQSQIPSEPDNNNYNNSSSNGTKKAVHQREDERDIQHQPHLRAVCYYNNDVNDMWRCVSLALEISIALASDSNLSCAIECWDMSDGHILLIEAADHLPSWVDEDVLQGGVGGPKGCRNRCWIVNGIVQLIPPMSQLCSTSASSSESLAELSRDDALTMLMRSINTNTKSLPFTSVAVQRAIEQRIKLTEYKTFLRKPQCLLAEDDQNIPNPHWHIAAVALPASVARFVQSHPYLVPLIVESFCECAPAYLREVSTRQQEWSKSDNARKPQADSKNDTPDKNSHQPTISKANDLFGNEFSYEDIVIYPTTFTRTNYAELVTGRGIVPTFPIPPIYRSVELNKFQRQLRQSAFGCDESIYEDSSKRRTRNPFHRAVDIGVRLCAGLDWILSNVGNREQLYNAKLDNSAIDSLGEVERRICLFWNAIESEASSSCKQTNQSWIEQAWQIGPNGGTSRDAPFDESWIHALQWMAKCRVFTPELCKPLWMEPCPYTRPGLSLLEMVNAGIKKALTWQRKHFEHESFPVPKVWEVDDDFWLEVDSLEDLEDTMRNISNRAENTEPQPNVEVSKPRRTTRRSRRNIDQGEQLNGHDEQRTEDEKSQTTVRTGVRSSVEGQRHAKSIIACIVAESTQKFEINTISTVPDSGNFQEVNINPRRFLNILHTKLCDLTNTNIENKEEEHSDHDNISKYFFQEDLCNGDTSEDSDCCSDDNIMDFGNNRVGEEDPWSLQNIMEAMDHELRTDAASDLSIKYLSLSSDHNAKDSTEGSDRDIIPNLIVPDMLNETEIIASYLQQHNTHEAD